MSVKGPPWDMWVSVEWTDTAKPRDGEPYANEGAHWIRLQRGKATYIHAYLDTEKVSELCRRVAEAGFEEAAEAPITG